MRTRERCLTRLFLSLTRCFWPRAKSSVVSMKLPKLIRTLVVKMVAALRNNRWRSSHHWKSSINASSSNLTPKCLSWVTPSMASSASSIRMPPTLRWTKNSGLRLSLSSPKCAATTSLSSRLHVARLTHIFCPKMAMSTLWEATIRASLASVRVTTCLRQ